MRGQLRRIACAFGVVAVTATVAAGCGSSSSTSTSGTTAGTGTESSEGAQASGASSSKPVKIAYFEFTTANTWTQASYQGAVDAAKKLGNVEIVQMDGKVNPETQAAQMQDALSSKEYDAWMIYQLGPAAFRYAEQAAKQGIATCGVLVPLGPKADVHDLQYPGQTCLTYDDYSKIGADFAELVTAACEGIDPCKVGYIRGVSALPSDQAVTNGFHSALKSSPNVKIVAEQDGQFLASPAYKVTQDMLQANPDLNVVMAGGDQMALGVERAIKADGKAGKVKVIGSYGSKLGVDGVKDKRWFGNTVSLPYDEGRLAVETLVAKVRGEPLPHGAVIDVVGQESPIDSRIITQDNVQGFKPQWTG